MTDQVQGHLSILRSKTKIKQKLSLLLYSFFFNSNMIINAHLVVNKKNLLQYKVIHLRKQN